MTFRVDEFICMNTIKYILQDTHFTYVIDSNATIFFLFNNGEGGQWSIDAQRTPSKNKQLTKELRTLSDLNYRIIGINPKIASASPSSDMLGSSNHIQWYCKCNARPAQDKSLRRLLPLLTFRYLVIQIIPFLAHVSSPVKPELSYMSLLQVVLPPLPDHILTRHNCLLLGWMLLRNKCSCVC